LVCIALHLVPTGEAVHFPKVQEIFDDQGQLLGKSQHSQARRLLEELIMYAGELKANKEQENILG